MKILRTYILRYIDIRRILDKRNLIKLDYYQGIEIIFNWRNDLDYWIRIMISLEELLYIFLWNILWDIL